jgi:hypothetical protein
VFRLDYFSCILTVLSTILVGRKRWTGLVVAGVNSLLLCIIGLRTAQLGFIPANVFCIVVYGFSIRAWIKDRATPSQNATGGWRLDLRLHPGDAQPEGAIAPSRSVSNP